MTVLKIESADLAEQVLKLKGAPKTADKHAKNAMKISVVAIVKAARPLAPVGVSGRLRRSIVSSVIPQGESIIGKAFSNLHNEIYPNVMEFGRRAGAKMPPPQSLERWVYLKLGVPRSQVKRVSFVIARSIARKGIKAKKFMARGFNIAIPDINRAWGAAGDQIVNELAVD